MKWKDSNDTVDLDFEAGEDPQSGKSFSMKKDNLFYHNGKDFFHGKKMPALLVGGGVLLLVLLLIWLIFSGSDNTNVQQIDMLESRIDALENRMAALDSLAKSAEAAAQQEKTMADLTRRVDGLQAVFTKEIDSLARRLAALPQQKTAAALPPAALPAIPKAAKKAPDLKTTHHVVQAGDNLYRISRRYNLKLDELMRLNNLKSGEEIYPGQKLLLTPSKP